MFMNGSSFDDDAPARGGSRGRKGRDDDVSDAVEVLSLDDQRTGSGAHPNALHDDDLDAVGGAEYLSGARSNVIQQQRELQKKKLQERMGGGVVRTSLPKQYSAPRSMDVDERPSRFGRDDDEVDDEGGRASRRAGSSRQSATVAEDLVTGIAIVIATVTVTVTMIVAVTTIVTVIVEAVVVIATMTGVAVAILVGVTLVTRTVIANGAVVETEMIVTRIATARELLLGVSVADHVVVRTTMTGTQSGEQRIAGEVVMTTAMTIVVLVVAEADSLAISRSRSASNSSDDDRNVNTATSYDPSSRDGDKGRAAAANARKPKLDITDMRAFILRPIPKAYDVVECYIERNKSGANKMFPEYCLYMKEGDRFLLTAKKRPKNRTSNYLISSQRGDLLRRGSDNYVGKLRANFLGTEFTIYDSGSSPKDADQQTITSNPAGIRQELGIAMYAANVLGHRGPRKMKVCVPRVRDDGTRVIWRPLNKEDEMVNKCKEQDHTNLTYLINKPPRWNDQVCAYVLNFNGRVTMASVKNFQLVTPEDQETVVLQFGRVGKDLFTMDFRWPLCPLQAFAITLSSFDSKLACAQHKLMALNRRGAYNGTKDYVPVKGEAAASWQSVKPITIQERRSMKNGAQPEYSYTGCVPYKPEEPDNTPKKKNPPILGYRGHIRNQEDRVGTTFTQDHGFMTKAQLKEAMRDLGCVFTDDQITALFGIHDPQCSGAVSMSEFLIAFTKEL
ncbi:hypothetical protein PHYBOEH_000860 [Phytophthora boehmeriae]|uniref:Tubby C-terminal domain-containing protein n=1 Tax=Phytophthora boehmeriae TaxID=109152 RepID=A0A8T1WYM8_9STRA|nr:hypothetical protein PHYBOEH_000860 [Phytophthora boehmeriae]